MDSVKPDPKNIPDDDLKLQNYQDDLDTSSSIHDPAMDEDGDDPTEELGIDPKEFKKELDKYDFETPTGDEDALYEGTEDDRREEIEDKDLDEGDTTKY